MINKPSPSLRIVTSVFLSVLLSACGGPKDKPVYEYGEVPLATFKTHDSWLAAVIGTRGADLSEFFGELDTLLVTSQRAVAPTSGTLSPHIDNSLRADFDLRTGLDRSEQWKIEFFQNDNGDLNIFYITLGDGTSIWLDDNSNAELSGVPLLPGDLAQGNQPERSFDVYLCTGTCTEDGNIGNLQVSLQGIEKQETERAFFYARRVSVALNFSFQNASNDNLTYAILGTLWVHPRAGIIKSSFNRVISKNSSLENDSFFTTFVQSSIKLP